MGGKQVCKMVGPSRTQFFSPPQVVIRFSSVEREAVIEHMSTNEWEEQSRTNQ